MEEENEKTQAEEIEELLAAKQKKAEASEESKENLEVEEEFEAKEEKKKAKEKIGVLYIYTSQNNTILTITDLTGNTIARSSGGQSTKQSRLKSSPTVAMFAAKKICEEAREAGITDLYVRIKAQTGSTSPGSASHAIIKSLSRDGFKIISIMDITRYPRGGPKKKGGRRGRRV